MEAIAEIFSKEFVNRFFADAVFAYYYAWLPVCLAIIGWNLWMHYIRFRYITNIDWVLLEIKIPREIAKSPKAAEVFINSLHIPSDGNLIKRYINGFQRRWFSLEIVSINGVVHFYVYTERALRNLVEAQVYSQYPDAEVVEADDYAKVISDPNFTNEWKGWGTEFKFVKDDGYPIKTYEDYGLLGGLLKEEQKIDPITTILENIGSIKQGEQIWIQILIRATRSKMSDLGKEIIDEILDKEREKEDPPKSPKRLTPIETDTVKAIEKKVGRDGFDVGIRAVYIARKEAFLPASRIPAIMGVITKQYTGLSTNGFKPSNATSVDYPIFQEFREAKRRKILFDAYKRRSFFYIPHERKPMVMTAEELATIYHFPGRVAETPTLGRIEAKKSEAPANLPT